MTVDDVLLYLAPLTPAVLPVIVYVWHRTRKELHGIRTELLELRQRPWPPDPRLDQLLVAVNSLSADVLRLTEAQRRALLPGTERTPEVNERR
jgi:hypothetical protein